MKENITAQWARETAENKLSKLAEEQLDTCLTKIQEEVDRNGFSTSLYFTPEDKLVTELEKRGFTVKYHMAMYQKDEDSFTISW